MASLLRNYSKSKLQGQIFTPFFIVDKILDEINYNSSDVLGKTILDPACGDGRFLVQIAKRIIDYSPKEDLIFNLEKIYGWDIDSDAVNKAIDNLNKLVAPFNIKVNWNIKVKNSLYLGVENLFNNLEKFDYIVGNPPYIRIQHLKRDEREFIQKNYKFCRSGSTDIYIAFYELAIKLLKNDGISGFITPNTFFYTQTAKSLREFFETNQNIIKIINYRDIQLFENASTYSAITIFGKKKRDNFVLDIAIDDNKFVSRKVRFEEIKDKPFWQLSFNSLNIGKGRKLGDIADIHVGITTLADKIYILEFLEEKEGLIYLKSKLDNSIIQIEKSILKPIIKASRFKSSSQKINEYIIFPYKKIGEKYSLIDEDEFSELYPLAYNYLKTKKDILLKRDNGKVKIWYQFGRTQGLNNSFGKKILFSPMNKKPNFVLSDREDATFYSGYSIKYNGDYNYLLEQLNSKRMEEFINASSRDFRGGWKAYNKKVLQEFPIY